MREYFYIKKVLNMNIFVNSGIIAYKVSDVKGKV